MPPMMTGWSFDACLRISASSAATSDRRLSSTAAMYSAGVFTLSCPFMAAVARPSHLRGADPPDGSVGLLEPLAGAEELLLVARFERDRTITVGLAGEETSGEQLRLDLADRLAALQ